MKLKVIGVFLNADSESPPMTYGKNASLESYEQKLFWSRDRLINHEFECLGLGLGL